MRALSRWRVYAVAVLLGFTLQAGAAGVDIPPLKSRVTDLTGTLPAQQVVQLEQRLAAFEKEKGVQIAVLMVPTVQPESIEEYAVRVIEQWKIGRKGIDDGVLLVIAKNDRKLRIEVGYGLEGALNDATAKRIISEDIVPHLKHGDFAAGVNAGVSRILRVAGGEPLPPVQQGQGRSSALPFDPMLLLAAFIFANPLTRMLRPLLGRVPAAGLISLAVGVGIGLVFGSLFAGLIAGAVIFFMGLAGGGNGGWGSGGSSWSSGDGSWTSGGGGFSSGGGFSGGGGSSGGGGASGSW